MCKIKFIFVLLFLYMNLVSVGLADDGTDDPDFDYLPPDKELGYFDYYMNSARSYFRFASHANNFTTAKRLLYNSMEDLETFYCACKTDLAARSFDRNSCGYVPRNESIRAKRTEAEHILPAYRLAQYRAGPSCWVREAECGGARKCCYKNDPIFKKAHDDLVNLIPAIGELNNDRSSHLFNEIDGEERRYGSCDFEVASEIEISEPRSDIRGNIARVYFYMRDSYELTFPDELTHRLDGWNLEDPVDAGEVQRNNRILLIQGNANPYVK